MKKLRAAIKQNEQGEVVEVSLRSRFGFSQLTDAGLVHLKGLTNLQDFHLDDTQITDAGLVHLKGLTNLQSLYLYETQVTDAGVAELKQALPNCKINK